MASIFSKIVNGAIPCFKIAEDELNFAFLDISPLRAGHVLVIPKREVDYIYDLDDAALSALNIFAKKIAVAMKKAITCRRIGITVIGLEVPHAHIHLIPIDNIDDMNFSKPILELSEEEMSSIRDSITQYL